MSKKRLEELQQVLFQSLRSGILELVEQVIDRTENDEERKELINSSARQQTILHMAAFDGHVDIIEWILSEQRGRAAGFDRVLDKNFGSTALHLAAQSRHLQACKAIVNGCRVENGERQKMLAALERNGGTILHFAAHSGQLEIIAWLLSQQEGGEAAGFDRSLITASTTDGSSVLHLAAESGVDSIQALLSNCTQQERMNLFLAVDKNGWTPLHNAARKRRRPSMIELLQHPECSLIANRKDNLGMTVLHRLIIGGPDERSSNNWELFFSPNSNVIAALLGSSETGWTSIDPNVGVGLE